MLGWTISFTLACAATPWSACGLIIQPSTVIVCMMGLKAVRSVGVMIAAKAMLVYLCKLHLVQCFQILEW
jgi:hypothetical protein